MRFCCSLAMLRRFAQVLDDTLPLQCGTVFLGSGDFHHLSLPLIARLTPLRPFQVVVLDNHPDNMRFPFGVHCGSWVRHVAALPQVDHVHVVGICSHDIGLRHAWENQLAPLRDGRVTYWGIGVDVRWAHWLGLASAFRVFPDAEALVDAFAGHQRRQARPAYLSIDKDVFSTEVAQTNWDQGVLQPVHARALIAGLRAGLVGSDITGEVSSYRYRRRWKRMLASLDAQPAVDERALATWQTRQFELDLTLLDAIANVACVPLDLMG
jgi:arginase family enzyme